MLSNRGIHRSPCWAAQQPGSSLAGSCHYVRQLSVLSVVDTSVIVTWQHLVRAAAINQELLRLPHRGVCFRCEGVNKRRGNLATKLASLE